MALFRVGKLPDAATAASAAFHAEVLPEIARVLAGIPDHLVIVFPPADHAHRAWRLAVVQSLAREKVPLRINAVESDDDAAIAAAHSYLARAEGLTGQLLPLDGHGAGAVV